MQLQEHSRRAAGGTGGAPRAMGTPTDYGTVEVGGTDELLAVETALTAGLLAVKTGSCVADAPLQCVVSFLSLPQDYAKGQHALCVSWEVLRCMHGWLPPQGFLPIRLRLGRGEVWTLVQV